MNSSGVLFTQDIWLATALTTCEVPFIKGKEISRLRDNGREVCVFNFETGKGGEEICQQWADKDFIEKNPEHPIAYLKAFTHNRERLLDCVKQRPEVQIVNRNGRLHLVATKPKTQTPQDSHD